MFLFTFVLVTCSACHFTLAPLPDTIQDQLDDAVEMGFEAIIVYVDQAGNAPVQYAAGLNNKKNKIPASPDDLFKIASISKLYIAAACAKMVNADMLSLDNPLSEYLPELADRIDNADQITLRMMLKHRSGIPNFTDVKDFPWDNLPETSREVLEFVLDKRADFKPDKKRSYSNTNYLLIGAIMDKTLGYSHHQYIADQILEPLGLNNTYSLLHEVDLDDVMSGYAVGYEPDIKFNDYVVPGGSMVATAEDVGIFMRALNDGSLFTKEEEAIYAICLCLRTYWFVTGISEHC